MRTLGTALAAVVAMLGFSFVAIAPAVADDVTVTFPSATQFNPTQTPYVITIGGDIPDGDYVNLSWSGGYGSSLEVTSPGNVSMDFGGHDGSGTVTASLCDGTSCSELAASQTLAVYTSLGSVSRYDDEGETGPDAPPQGWFSQQVTLGLPVSVESTWSDAGGVVGTMDGEVDYADSGGITTFDIPLPPGIASGTYDVSLTVSRETSQWGTLSSEMNTSVMVDAVPAEARMLAPQGTSFYPERDNYENYMPLKVTSNEDAEVRHLVVADSDGDQVGTIPVGLDYVKSGRPLKMQWKGTVKGGKIAAPGVYTISADVVDDGGNVTKVSIQVTALPGHYEDRKLRLHETAKAGLVQTIVGTCSQVSSPGSHGWKGSIELSSYNRCLKKGQGAAGIIDRLYIPKSADGYYAKISFDVYGGPARGRSLAGPGNDLAYAGFLKGPKGKVATQQALSTQDRWHGAGGFEQTGTRQVIYDLDTKPYVLVYAIAAAGAHYDIGSYRMQGTYDVWVK
jgi:hypothetical protein